MHFLQCNSDQMSVWIRKRFKTDKRIKVKGFESIKLFDARLSGMLQWSRVEVVPQ